MGWWWIEELGTGRLGELPGWGLSNTKLLAGLVLSKDCEEECIACLPAAGCLLIILSVP